MVETSARKIELTAFAKPKLMGCLWTDTFSTFSTTFEMFVMFLQLVQILDSIEGLILSFCKKAVSMKNDAHI